MSATSVTGLSGKGIAYGARGPGNKRNVFVPNVAPHIVAAGTHTDAGAGTGTVLLSDPLVGNVTDYMVLVQSQGTSATGSIVITKTASSSKMTGFTYAGATVSIVLGWAIVNLGQGMDTVAGVEVVS